MGKHLHSPEGGENALPQPKSSAPFGGHAGGGKTLKSPRSVSGCPEGYSTPTPDMMGPLFGHHMDKDGV